MLEPEVRAHLDAGDPTGLDTADAPERRVLLTREINRMFTLFGLPGPTVDDVRDHDVPVDGGTIRIRTYHPTGSGPVLPAHVIVHGGGWTTGSIDELVADHTARHRAVGAGCVAVLVDYRLAPEFPFPTPVHDVLAAVRWVHEHAAALGVDPHVVTLGGSSAGANLAVAAVLADPDLRVHAMVLEVPAMDLRRGGFTVPHDVDPELAELLAPSDAEYDQVVVAEYLRDRELASSPLASPLLAPDLTSFPETHILTAELDVLRPGAEQFADRLRRAGVPVDVTCYAGALHGSPILTRTWPTARRWHDDILAILNRIHARAAHGDVDARESA